jgi:hypothetical protein
MGGATRARLTSWHPICMEHACRETRASPDVSYFMLCYSIKPFVSYDDLQPYYDSSPALKQTAAAARKKQSDLLDTRACLAVSWVVSTFFLNTVGCCSPPGLKHSTEPYTPSSQVFTSSCAMQQTRQKVTSCHMPQNHHHNGSERPFYSRTMPNLISLQAQLQLVPQPPLTSKARSLWPRREAVGLCALPKRLPKLPRRAKRETGETARTCLLTT